MMTTYQMPIRKIDVLLEFCRSIDLGITENDIRKPDPERWRIIYGDLLMKLANISPDQFQQQQLNFTRHFEHPILHEESSSLMTFTMVLQRIMHGCGHQDFHLGDVIEPSTKRLIITLSAVMNFYHFKEERMDTYEKLKCENENVREQRDYLVKANDELQQRINTIKAKQAEEEQGVKNVQEEIDILFRNNSEYHKVHGAYQKEINEIKEKLAEKTASKDQIKVEILNVQKENEKLSQKIVQSPERLKQELERMEHKVSNMRTSLVDKQNHLGHLRTQKEKMVTTEACAEKGLKLVQSIQEDINKETEVKREMLAVRDKQQEQHDIVSALTVKKKDLEQLLSSTQDKTPRLISQHRLKMASIKHLADNRNKELSVLKERQNVKEVEKIKVIKEKQHVEAAIEGIEKQNMVEIQVVEEQYAKIVNMLDEFHVGLGQGIEKVLKID